MIFNDHDLRQINQAYIESLDTETAKKLASKLLEDLYVIDILMGDEDQPGITVTNIKHLYGDTICLCGHVMHSAPHRCEKEEDRGVELTEWHLVEEFSKGLTA